MSKYAFIIFLSALLLTSQVQADLFWEEDEPVARATILPAHANIPDSSATVASRLGPGKLTKPSTAALEKAVPKQPAKPMMLPYDPSIKIRSPSNNPTIDKNLRVSLQSNYMKEADRWYKAGANVNAQDNHGRGLLYLAVMRKHVEGAEFLLLRHADVKQVNDDGTTPLQAAVQTGQARIVQMLLERNAEITAMPNGGTMIHHAISRGFPQIAVSLIERGVDVHKTYTRERTLLHIAAAKGMAGPVQALLNRGANINARNHEKATPLHEAAARGHAHVVKLLLSRKANVNAETKGGWRALHHAARFGHSDIVNMLLSKGASPNNRNAEGNTPLALAKHLQHQPVVEILASRTRGGLSGGSSSTRGGWFW